MLFRKIFNRQSKLGFTLIEVIISIVVIGILTTVLAPTLIKYMEESRISSDLQTGQALVNSVNNALSDPAVFDEVYHYSVSNNFITYSDSSGTYASQSNDQEYWAPDGMGWATTITFNPALAGGTEYLLTEVIINDMTYNNGSIVSPARVLENCDAYITSCYLNQMTTDDETVSAKLYTALTKDFDNRIQLKSRTYSQSSYTVFVKFEIIDDNLSAQVYGSFNGTNLDPSCSAALGTGTTEIIDTPTGPQGNGTQSGTTDAVFDFSALAGGGISSNTGGSTGAINNIKPAATNAVLDKNKFLSFCQAVPNKTQIQNIKFVAAGARGETTDVSVNGDGSVVAWTEGLDICVSASSNNSKFFAPVDASNLFNVNYTGLPNIINVSTIYADMSKTTSVSSMFQGNTSLVSIDLTGQTLESCLDMSYIFSGCSNLKTLRMPDARTNKVTNMSGVFENCERLSNFPYQSWNTSNVTNMSSMFKGCSRLQSLSVSRLNVSKVQDFGHMFEGCSRLKSLDLSAWGVQVDNGRIFTAMFKDCLQLKELNLDRWEISGEVTNLGQMFASCKSLQAVDTASLFVNGTAKCVDFNRMFYDCSYIKELDLSKFNTSKAADMDAMFDNMIRLQTISLGGSFAFSGNGNTRCYLPEPSSIYIPGANGTWNNEAGISYYPREVPSRRADTYSAISTVTPAILAPRATWWKSETTNPSAITRIVIANSFTGGQYTEKWNADDENSGSLEVYVNGNIAYIVNNQNKKPSNAFMLSEDASGMFANFVNLTTIDGLKLVNTVNVSNMNNFFGKWDEDGRFVGCTKLTSVKDIESWNMANVKYADYMFAGTAITSLTLSQWQVPNISSAEGMFYNTKLTALDINGWDLSSAINLQKMFAESKNLIEIKANGMKVNKAVTPTDMFKNCSSLTTINTTSDFDLSESKPIVSMFEGCVKLQGNSGTKFSADKVTNEQAHIDNGSSGYFTGVNATTGIITARIYEQGLATGTNQVLTTSGIDINWDYTKGNKLVEIKLSSLPRNREKILTIKVPMGMYIVQNSWTPVNDDISKVEFKSYDTSTTSGLQQGTGKYTNSQTGTLTYTIAPYTKDTTITLQIMMDTTLWDKCRYNPSTSGPGSYYTINNNYQYLTKEDVLTLTLDDVEVKKIKNASSTSAIGAASNSHGWGHQYSIWQQNSNMYLDDANQSAPYNGNLIETIDRTNTNWYYKSVDYEIWCEQRKTDGSKVYARYTTQNPAAQNGTTSTSSTSTVYKAHWDNIYATGTTRVYFPCIVFKAMKADGFAAGKAYICHKVVYETFSGRKVTAYKEVAYNIIEDVVDFKNITIGGTSVTTLDETHYEEAGAAAWLGTWAPQNNKKAALPNAKVKVTFDKNTAIGNLPKLKVMHFRAPLCANQTVDMQITLINDSGNSAGPYTYSAKSSGTTNGAPLFSQQIATQNNLTGKWYLKTVEYTIPTITGTYMNTYLYVSGHHATSNGGGIFMGTASANAVSNMTISGVNPDGKTITISKDISTYVTKVATADKNSIKFSGGIDSITANASMTAGDEISVKARLKACYYPGTSSSGTCLFTRPVLYMVLPDGVSIKEGSVIISNSSNTTPLAESTITYIKSVEKSGALYNIYKVSFANKVPFGYWNLANYTAGTIDNAVKDVHFVLQTDSAMTSTTLNWQNTIFFTDEYGNISNGAGSDRMSTNMFYDSDDVDNDGNTSERFASIASAKYLTIS